jgi:hypothetical protein
MALDPTETYIMNTLKTVRNYLCKAEHDLANRNYPGVAYWAVQASEEARRIKNYLVHKKLVK